MIIECYGLPGTGKSTIATRLASCLSGELVRVPRRRELVWFNLLSFLRHPLKFVLRTARAFHEGQNPTLLYYKLVEVFLHRNAVVEKARGFPVAIVDEGHLQNILSAFEKPLSYGTLLKELENLELPHILLHFTLLEDERQMRLQNRSSPRAICTEEYRVQWEEAMRANDQLLTTLLPTLPIKYINVDWQMTEDALCSLLKAQLQISTR